MTRWIFVLFLCVAHSTVLRGEPFERAEVTKTINLVSILPRAKRAVPGDVIKGDSALKTGGDSRAELQFPDLTIARVGSNALFRFIAGARGITLDGGTMLFSSPKGAGGGTVQAGAITAAVTGSDFLIANAGRVKVICLSHEVMVYFTAKPKIRVVLRPGQMVDIAGGATKMPPVTRINLAALLSKSMLGEAGGLGPFPNQSLLVRKQTAANGSTLAANDPAPGTANLATEAAQARSSTVTNKNPSPPTVPGSGGTVGNSATGGTVGNSATGGTVGNSATGGTVGNSATGGTVGNGGSVGNGGNGGSGGNGGNSGTGGSKGNMGNRRDIQNRGNSGVRLDRGNR